jgi:hypothetical protein
MTDESAFEPRQGQEIFPCSKMSGLGFGRTKSPIQWVSEDYSPGVKRPLREADQMHLVARLGISDALPPLYGAHKHNFTIP